MDGQKLSRNVISIGIILLGSVAIVLIVCPIMVIAAYTFWVSDDIGMAYMLQNESLQNIGDKLMAAFRITKDSWLGWQGTYTAYFVQVLILTCTGDLDWTILRLIMVVNAGLFIGSLSMVVFSVCKSFCIEVKYRVVILLICFSGIFCLNEWAEAFWWFSGAFTYTFQLSSGFLGIAICLQSDKHYFRLMACVLLFLSSGGSLMVPGLICWILLSICIAKKCMDILQKKDVVLFSVAVISALFNAVAPGNYIRHSVIDSTGLHLGKALLGTMVEVVRAFKQFSTPPRISELGLSYSHLYVGLISSI